MSARAGDLPVEADDLSAERVARILDARDARVRGWARAAPPAVETVVLLVARLGEALVGLPASRLAAVASPVEPTFVPGAPPALAGVFGHRGRLHSLLLPDGALGLPVPAEPRRIALVLRGAARALAFGVDEVFAVTHAVPDAGGSRYAQADGHGAVLMIDVDEVLATLGIGATAAGRSEGR